MNVKLFKPHAGQKAIIDKILEDETKWQIVVTGRQ